LELESVASQKSGLDLVDEVVGALGIDGAAADDSNGVRAADELGVGLISVVVRVGCESGAVRGKG
jgi:hypothetical protein